MNRISSKKFLALFGCSFVLTIAYMSLSSWGLAIPSLSETFQLNDIMIQLGNAALIAGYAVGSFVEGRLLLRWGWRKTFLFAMCLFLAGSLLIPFVTSYPVIVFLRFLMGFGILSPILVPYIAGMTSWTVGWIITAAAGFICMVISLVLPKIRVKNQE